MAVTPNRRRRRRSLEVGSHCVQRDAVSAKHRWLQRVLFVSFAIVVCRAIAANDTSPTLQALDAPKRRCPVIWQVCWAKLSPLNI